MRYNGLPISKAPFKDKRSWHRAAPERRGARPMFSHFSFSLTFERNSCASLFSLHPVSTPQGELHLSPIRIKVEIRRQLATSLGSRLVLCISPMTFHQWFYGCTDGWS